MLQGRLRQAMAMGSHSLPILDQVTKVGGTVIGIITATSLQGPCGRLLADILRQEKHISPMSWWYFMIFYVLSRVKPLLWGLPGRKWSRQIHIYIYIHMWDIIVRSCIRIYTYTIHLPSHDPSHASALHIPFLQLSPSLSQEFFQLCVAPACRRCAPTNAPTPVDWDPSSSSKVKFCEVSGCLQFEVYLGQSHSP